MADELKRIRVTFVDSANRELIKELLDGLLEDGVLNDGQKDSILEENPSTKDKARALIDTVKKKGDAASNKMIALLLSKDPTLHAALGLSSEKPAQPAAAPEPQLGQDGSGTLIHSTKDFWKGKQGRRDTYPADKESMRHRVALLITNIKFTDTRFDRAGADRDEKNMLKLLDTLGYEVVTHRNLTGKEIDAAVIEFSKHEKLKKTDSVVVVIMSHGKRGAVLGVDWKEDKPDEFSIDNIYLHLDSKGCPALLDKPKIILIQACRGVKEGSVEVEDGLSCDDASLYAGHEDFEEDGFRIVNKEKDFLALLSSTPDTPSYRNPQLGSRLIRSFVAVVNTSADVDHIEELCRKVQQRFVDLEITKQMPTKDRGTLIKHFYFFPGI
ncbi:caspase-1-like [Trematomus bernacchii]|uniref:caspase-1-like n=1 Tax=Trematomus bernacchii TaxID=40690 RepID=UPI00146AA08F|nr:caspase-1-like [Trematomus bernacchii]